jgi:hypothetical protein
MNSIAPCHRYDFSATALLQNRTENEIGGIYYESKYLILHEVHQHKFNMADKKVWFSVFVLCF